ncbi:MAG: TetR/AcrR family transcriptional regulator [SAR202 cluster bacterium]|nr:TetR/AcrR family transcriptional regulator [SAR202 cluster bacterium]
MVREKVTARDKIMEAAEALFAEKGYHDAAMDDIVRLTEVSKGGLYFHFPSKERLFFAVMDHLADRLVERVRKTVSQEPTALRRLEVALDTVLDSLGQKRPMAKLLLVQGYSMGNAFEKKRVELYSRFAVLIKENLDQAVTEGSIEDIDTEITSHIWLGAINEVVALWLYTGKPSPTKEARPVLKRLLLKSIMKKPTTQEGA